MSEVQSQRKQVVMAEVMPPERANFTGHIHGGYLVLLLDRVAYACAARYSGQNVVTVSIDEVLFKQPIYVGELVTFYASVNHVGRSSVVIGVKVTSEDLKTGEVRHTNTSYLTMVAIDEHGKPTPVPKLEIYNDVEKRRFAKAQALKEIRKEYQERLSQL